MIIHSNTSTWNIHSITLNYGLIDENLQKSTKQKLKLLIKKKLDEIEIEHCMVIR